MDLIFDTETSGLPGAFDPGHSAYPHILQLAMALREPSTARLISHVSVLVCPAQDFIMNPRAQEVHGITKEQCALQGIPAEKALALFRIFARLATRLVAFNIDFDWGMIKALAYRSNVGWEQLPVLPKFDVLEVAKPFCAIPPTEKMVRAGRLGFKPPSLTEAHRILIGEDFPNAHDAMGDLIATNTVLTWIERQVADGSH